MKVILISIVLQVVAVFAVKYLWNEVISELIMAKKIDYIQALGICLFFAFIRLSGSIINQKNNE